MTKPYYELGHRPHKIQKLEPSNLTAQPTGHRSKGYRSHQREISIQSLSSNPDLLPNRWMATPTKTLRDNHKPDCECQKCEERGEDINELNFDLD